MNLLRLLIITAIAILMSACNRPNIEPPKADKIEHPLIMHGDTRMDPYYWMRERENPRVIEYLQAENRYLQAKLGHTKDLQNQLFEEMKGRIKQDAQSAPVLSNDYYYYTRYEQGGEYPLYCRKSINGEAKEEIILNVPELAKPHPYFSIGSYAVSPDNTLLAFTFDTVGRRMHSLHIKNLISGDITSTEIQNAGGDVVWAADNKHIFFTGIDPITLRYDRIFRYNILESASPQEVYYEKDDTYYYMGVSKTKDEEYLVINSQSTLNNEVRILESRDPKGAFRVFEPRQRGHLYEIEHRKGTFYIITNNRAQNFRLMSTSANQTGSTHWKEEIAHRPDVLLESMSVFNEHLVLQERKNGLRQLHIMHLKDPSNHYIAFEEDAYTSALSANWVMDTDILRFSYTSLTTPLSVYDYNMNTRSREQVWQQEVPGGFNQSEYETSRIFVNSRDGVKIPVSLVYKSGMQKNHQNPLLQYAYGSYGMSADPRFNSNIISLLDRGFIYAIAHVRGGQEMGRQWYEDGKLLNKKNTFFDFMDVSESLIEQGFTSPENLFAMGGSAGGLLMGAIMNMRPDLYKGIIAAVPFVDVVTTMLDESIPLTTSEYDEWGNPNDPEYYHYMLSYSPYDQISQQVYPNVLITSGLHDSQVQYWEPTKWAARLRDYNTGESIILLETNMDAGHGGASGRFRRLHEIAKQYAFLIDLLD